MMLHRLEGSTRVISRMSTIRKRAANRSDARVYSRALRASRAYEQDCGTQHFTPLHRTKQWRGTAGAETTPAHPAKVSGAVPRLQRGAVTWQTGQHQPDSLAALVVAQDVLVHSAGRQWSFASPLDPSAPCARGRRPGPHRAAHFGICRAESVGWPDLGPGCESGQSGHLGQPTAYVVFVYARKPAGSRLGPGSGGQKLGRVRDTTPWGN
jgi:hypothetical protein